MAGTPAISCTQMEGEPVKRDSASERRGFLRPVVCSRSTAELRASTQRVIPGYLDDHQGDALGVLKSIRTAVEKDRMHRVAPER